ncbi:hypothetical protein TSAR_000190 [Trichomalopsis sarcophagae]|uniref:Uncharacterized protein n=1 Tax=Trichomalopsis sarcophagae TaxID=543379 RepID=A0A232EU24_9HYME|nr:hypothetical protein TSAR_000190 [Trichomalopsis sarcophagae]
MPENQCPLGQVINYPWCNKGYFLLISDCPVIFSWHMVRRWHPCFFTYCMSKHMQKILSRRVYSQNCKSLIFRPQSVRLLVE